MGIWKGSSLNYDVSYGQEVVLTDHVSVGDLIKKKGVNKLNKEMNVTDEQLIFLYAEAFGRQMFDKQNQELRDKISRLKSEIIKRMNPTIKLQEMLADENVVIGQEKLEEVFNLLAKNLNLDKIGDKAKMIVAMDCSGSMGSFEIYMCKSFIMWVEKLLASQYKSVSKEFIRYFTEATSVSEEEMFSQHVSGGTITSSALFKVNETINYYDYEKEDTYIFLLSDGDNLTSDNERCLRLIKDIERKAKQVVYFEINQFNRSSTLMTGFKHFQSEKFKRVIVREKNDLLDAIKKVFE